MQLFFFPQGAKRVRRFHACPLRIPEGLGDLTKKIPKGAFHYNRNNNKFLNVN